MEDCLSARQAAEIIGMPYPTIIKHLVDGNLTSQRMGVHYSIRKDDLIAFKVAHARGEFTNTPKVKERERLEQIAREVSEAVQQRLSNKEPNYHGLK